MVVSTFVGLSSGVHGARDEFDINATLNSPTDIVVWRNPQTNRDCLVFSDTGNNIIRCINLDNSTRAAAGCGGAGAVVVVRPEDVSPILTCVSFCTEYVRTLAGRARVTGVRDGDALDSAQFFQPSGLAVHPIDHSIYVTDFGSSLIRRISSVRSEPSGEIEMRVETIAGAPADHSQSTDGTGSGARFDRPISICMASSGQFALVADRGSALVRRLDLSTTPVPVTTCRPVKQEVEFFGQPRVIIFDRTPSPTADGAEAEDSVVFLGTAYGIRRFDMRSGVVSAVPTSDHTRFKAWEGGRGGFIIDPVGLEYAAPNTLVVACKSTRRLYEVDTITAAVRTLAGTGDHGSLNGGVSVASFSYLEGVRIYRPSRGVGGCVSRAGIYVSDNNCIRVLDLPWAFQ